MIESLAIAMLLAGGASGDHGCPERPHDDRTACSCTYVVDFYNAQPPGPPIYVRTPGIRVIGRPIEVAGPVVHIQGPPVYVETPPIRVRPAQIHIQQPDVHVRPSDIIVEPPSVSFSGCPDGSNSCPR